MPPLLRGWLGAGQAPPYHGAHRGLSCSPTAAQHFSLPSNGATGLALSLK